MSRFVTSIALLACVGCEAPSYYPEDPAPRDPGADDLACSSGPGVDGSLTIENATGADLLVYLVDSACLEQYAGTVPAGDALTWTPAQATVWQVRDPDLAPIEQIRVPGAEPVTVVIAP